MSPKRSRRKYQRQLDGVQKTHLIALIYHKPLQGYMRWSLRLLAREMVRLECVEEVSHKTVWKALKDNELKPWLRDEWCIPPKSDADFVYHMEDVLDIYRTPVNTHLPLVCFEETPVQLVNETFQQSFFTELNVTALTISYRYNSKKSHHIARGKLAHAPKVIWSIEFISEAGRFRKIPGKSGCFEITFTSFRKSA